MSDTDIYDAIRAHYEIFFKGHQATELPWERGAIVQAIPSFRTIRAAPGPKTRLWTYLSVGAWEVAHCPVHRLEFFLLALEPEPSHVETLAMLAFYHRDHRLGLGHTLPIGRPWLPGSDLDHLLLSLPYTFGPRLENLSCLGIEVQVLWAIPISESEKRFRHQEGLEALEVRFEQSDLDYWNPARASVVEQ